MLNRLSLLWVAPIPLFHLPKEEIFLHRQIHLINFAAFKGGDCFEMTKGNYCHILPTAKTPEVLFDAEGTLSIKGRAMALNRTAPSEKLLDCIDRYLQNPARTTTITISLEYLNSFGTQIIVAIIRKLSVVTKEGKILLVKWYYDEEDDDILERGHHIAETFDVPIEFIPIEDTSLFN